MTKQTDVHVVLIEDEVANRRSLARALVCVGYKVSDFAEAEPALEFLDQHRDVALVITDLHMPDGDGGALLSGLRDRGAMTPVILVSGHISTRYPMDLLSAGFVEFLAKPISPANLATAVRRVLDRC